MEYKSKNKKDLHAMESKSNYKKDGHVTAAKRKEAQHRSWQEAK